MKRVIRIMNPMGYEDKYIFIEEYNGWGVYQRKTPTGYFVHQCYAITKESRNLTVECDSFNNMCKEELFDAIDNYEESGKLGFKAFCRGLFYCVHPNGNVRI